MSYLAVLLLSQEQLAVFLWCCRPVPRVWVSAVIECDGRPLLLGRSEQ